MAVPHVPEEQLLRELDQWEAQCATSPTIWDAARQPNANVFAGFVLRGFRAATKDVVGQRDRVIQLRNLANLAMPEAGAAEQFLRSEHPSLGTSPLASAVASWPGLDEALRLLAPHLSEPAAELFQLICRSWALTDDDQASLLSTSAEVMRNVSDQKVSPEAVRRVLLLVTVYWLVPADCSSFEAVRNWLRDPLGGEVIPQRSPLDIMIADGEDGILAVRRHLLAAGE